MKLPEIKPKKQGEFTFKEKLTKKERFNKAKKMTHLLGQLDNAFTDPE